MAKSYFFYAMLAMVGFGLIGFFLYHFGRGLLGIFSDWRLHRELDELEADAEARRQARAEANTKRLDNGCEHDFDGALGGFPTGVCHKCGLAREKPTGTCDHHWRAGEGPVPHSVCQKCGKNFNANKEATRLA